MAVSLSANVRNRRRRRDNHTDREGPQSTRSGRTRRDWRMLGRVGVIDGQNGCRSMARAARPIRRPARWAGFYAPGGVHGGARLLHGAHRPGARPPAADRPPTTRSTARLGETDRRVAKKATRGATWAPAP